MVIGDGNLENTLGQIHGHGRSMHVGLLVFVKLIPTPMETSAAILRGKQTGESIPSLRRQRKVTKREALTQSAIRSADAFGNATTLERAAALSHTACHGQKSSTFTPTKDEVSHESRPCHESPRFCDGVQPYALAARPVRFFWLVTDRVRERQRIASGPSSSSIAPRHPNAVRRLFFGNFLLA
jgi:hypothetical protein